MLSFLSTNLLKFIFSFSERPQNRRHRYLMCGNELTAVKVRPGEVSCDERGSWNMIKNYVITNIPFIAHRQMALIIFYGTQCGIIIWSDTIRNPINHKLMSCFLENLMKMLLGKKSKYQSYLSFNCYCTMLQCKCCFCVCWFSWEW